MLIRLPETIFVRVSAANYEAALEQRRILHAQNSYSACEHDVLATQARHALAYLACGSIGLYSTYSGSLQVYLAGFLIGYYRPRDGFDERVWALIDAFDRCKPPPEFVAELPPTWGVMLPYDYTPLVPERASDALGYFNVAYAVSVE